MRAILQQLLQDRRAFAAGTPDHDYRTRSARKRVWMLRGVPVNDWTVK